jgi:hypothetical protein
MSGQIAYSMASLAYSRDYRDWLVAGLFEENHAHAGKHLRDAVDMQRPDLVAPSLRELAVCFYTRGAVSLMDGRAEGWRVTTGLEADLKDSPAFVTRAVMTLGLARLFSVDFDEQLLRQWLAPRYDVAVLTGKVSSGRYILDSIYFRDTSATAEMLRRDRRECCQKRDAWPKRPTENEPFGILDVEMALRFPDEAEFPYALSSYTPTEDEFVIEGIATYHRWYDSR